MLRRARIKAVANLSSVRRGVNKTNSEKQESENSKRDSPKNEIESNSRTNADPDNVEVSTSKKQQENVTSSTEVKNDDVNNKYVSFDESKKIELNNTITTECSVNFSLKETENHPKRENFKTPVNLTETRQENEVSAVVKFRKPKITPRLNISRSVTKPQENGEKSKASEEIEENPAPNTTPVQNDKQTELSVSFFSPPRTPRAETSIEITDSPGIIVNHNVHQPPTPQSPFYPISHPRIRTESLCSIKSTTVANLQPRKKVRTEDQKILDNKRESRERLSNKAIEKSQLRMFDMIYYNPTTNPMKPRTMTKEKSQKKIDLTAELPPPSPAQKESAAIPVPQLKLNANGELVLDEASLVVENEEQKKNRILLANTNVVYHDELSGTYGYYKRQQRTKEWPQEETIKFYRCLNTVGTDFSLMLNLFPNRSRRDLKLKFKKEEKTNPHLVDKALLNHNTFDIEELQRELDQEDEIRRKEAESKSNEVKELVKRKILKKQEAKAKAHQQDKAKIEKILSDGDLVLDTVNNKTDQEVKENSAGKRSRKRKNIKPEPHMEFKKIVLSSKFKVPISVSELKSPERNNECQATTATEMKSPAVLRRMSFTDTNNLVPMKSTSNLSLHTESSCTSIITKSEQNQDEEESIKKKISKEDTMLSTTGRFLSDLITDSYHENEYLTESESGCSLILVKKEEPKQKAAIEEVSHDLTPQTSVSDFESIMSPNQARRFSTTSISQFPTENYFGGENAMTSYNHSTERTEEYHEMDMDLEPSYENSSSEIVSSHDNSTKQIEPSLNAETIIEEPSSCVEQIDDESFLNSLDLEKLVIVIKQVDGKDIYDIHEATDADSQNISEKPLNLPRRIVDLIVSVMTQDD